MSKRYHIFQGDGHFPAGQWLHRLPVDIASSAGNLGLQGAAILKILGRVPAIQIKDKFASKMPEAAVSKGRNIGRENGGRRGGTLHKQTAALIVEIRTAVCRKNDFN